jgi:hypothetical protein
MFTAYAKFVFARAPIFASVFLVYFALDSLKKVEDWAAKRRFK